jgi:hypothetical protein
LRASKNGDFDIRFLGNWLYGYKNLIYFDNDLRRINKGIRASEEANIAWWMGDYRKPSQLPITYLHEDVKYIFMNVRYLIPSYKKLFNIPVYYMPLCGLSIPENKKRNVKWDVLFIGNVHGTQGHRERYKILDSLKKFNFKHISGEGFSEDQRYLYKNTPINVSMSYRKDGLTSNRLFNILASEGFALVRYFPGIEEMFVNHSDLVWFDSVEEMEELVKYYLLHPDERKRIAEQGHKTYIHNHTAKHRIQNMVDIMEGKTNRFYGYRS